MVDLYLHSPIRFHVGRVQRNTAGSVKALQTAFIEELKKTSEGTNYSNEVGTGQ
jgi:hypothetical protein